MSTANRTPAQLRNMFGANLRHLSQRYPSISQLARQLQINRTQFNRYLSGESFPRPDVLARICSFFGVDARVLLEPVDDISGQEGPVCSPFLKDFMGTAMQEVSERDFPSGFYHFSRRSFMRETAYARGLIHVRRDGTHTFLRGYEPKIAMAMQGIPTGPQAREYRGYVLRVEDGVTLTITRRKGLTASLTYLNRVISFENNYWVGYVARTVREDAASTRLTRIVFEHIADDLPRALLSARTSGFCDLDDLIPFHQRLLQPGVPMK